MASGNEYSRDDASDEIDLEALVKQPAPVQKKETAKAPAPQPKQEKVSRPPETEAEFDLSSLPKAPPAKPVAAPRPPAPKPAEVKKQPPPVDEFDIESVKPAAKKQEKPVEKKQPPAEPVYAVTEETTTAFSPEGETKYDNPVARDKIRILPSFPTLILIIIVSLVSALITGVITGFAVRLSTPSLQDKVQEVLSNQENTSIKVNTLEQTVAKLSDEIKALQEQSRSQASVKK